MKIHLVKETSINGFTSVNAKAKVPFNNWIAIVKRTDWNNPNDIQATFNSADMLGNGTNRVVFNVGGNNYRMICQYHFGESVHIYLLSGLAIIKSTHGCAKKANNILLMFIK